MLPDVNTALPNLVVIGAKKSATTSLYQYLASHPDYGAPMTVALFAGMRVRDVKAARAWYERLLGEPSFFPNAAEVVWTLADDRSLYIEEDPRRAGGALITVFVDGL